MIRFDWRALCLSILTALVCTSLVWPWLSSWQAYPDVVASGLAMRGEVKSSDFQALGIFFVIAASVYWGWIRLLREGANAPLEIPLAWAAYHLGYKLVSNNGALVWREPVACSILLALFLLVTRRFSSLDRRPAAILLLAAAFLWTAAAVAAGWLFWPLMGTFVLLTSAAIWRYRELGALHQALVKVLYAGQAMAPILLVLLLPRAVQHKGTLYPADRTALLAGVLVSFAVAGWGLLYLRYRRNHRALALRRHLEPVCVAPLVLLAGFTVSGFPTIPYDDFHLGEQVLPWQQWMAFGRTPYVDLVPIHGLMPMARSALNALFFDGKMSHFMNSVSLFNAGTAGLTFGLLLWRAGAAPALLFLASVPTSDRLFLLGPTFLILTIPKLWRRPDAWICTAAILNIVLIAYNLPVGAAAVLGLAVLYYVQERKLIKARRLPKAVMVVAATMLLILLWPPARAAIAAYVEFGIYNGSINAVAHSMSWGGLTSKPTPYPGILHSPLLFELMKYSWIFTAGILGVLAIRTRQPLAVMAVLTSIALVPWSMGRIGDGGLSRPGHASHYMLVVFLPAILAHHRMLRRPGTWALLALIAGIYCANGRAPLSLHAARSFSTREPSRAPDDYVRVTELPNLGVVYLEAARAAEVRTICATIERLTGPNGTFLDLTNRQAFYFHCGKPAPTKYPAPYVAASAKLQLQMLRQMENASVPLVWAEPAIPFGDPPVHVRNYLLFRHVLTRYSPCRIQARTFFVAPQLAPSAGCEGTASAFDLMEPMVWRDLGRMPESWGKSWSTLSNRFTDSLLLPGPVAANLSVDPKVHDFLSIQLACDSCPPSPVTIRWNSDIAQGPRTMKFTSGPGRVLAPLGSYPEWLLARQINAIQVEPSGGLRAGELTLLRYSPQ